uniref:Uncharacterized protein n=1 Tax=termite gut metagenome TaxID=433724 RepID=S0DET4_9ZZZZ
MKRIFAILLVCTMLVSALAACGGGGGAQTSASSPPAASTPSEASQGDAGAVAAGEGKEIDIWICQWGSEKYEDAIKGIADSATAANINGQGYKVNAKMISWDGFYETYVTAYTSNTGPAIASEANTAPILYHLQDAGCDLMPIYDAWVEEGNPIIETIPQEYFDFFTVDGQLIGMPFGCDTPGVIYNKELLADIGVDAAPTSWEEILDACAKLKEKYPDRLGFVFPADTPAAASNFGGWFLRQHSSTYKSLEYTGNLMGERSQLALENFKALVDNEYITEAVLTYTTDDVHRVFLNDDALFAVTGMPTWVAEGGVEKYGFLEPLTIEGEQGYTQVAVNAFYIYSGENDEDAKAVLKWWMENNYEQWSVGEDFNIPARADYCDQLYVNNPLNSAFYDATIGYGRISMDSAPFDTQDETASEFDNTAVMGDVLTALLNGSTIEEAAEIGDTIVNDIYAKYGY